MLEGEESQNLKNSGYRTSMLVRYTVGAMSPWCFDTVSLLIHLMCSLMNSKKLMPVEGRANSYSLLLSTLLSTWFPPV
jgi:hypothetical protein